MESFPAHTCFRRRLTLGPQSLGVRLLDPTVLYEGEQLKPSAKVMEETEPGHEFAFGDAHLGKLWLDHCTFLASKVSGRGRRRKAPSRLQRVRTSLVWALALLGPLL